MRHLWMIRIGRWLAILLLTLASALLLAAPARADGDTVTLSTANGTSFTYAGTQPSFTAVVTFGTKPTANYFWMVKIDLEDGESFSSVNGPTPSPDGMTLTFTRIIPPSPIAAGQHAATATFNNPGTGTAVTSAPITFTVNKATVDLACSVDNQWRRFVGVDETLNLYMIPYSGSGALPAAWLNGTYSVTFDGPTQVTYSNLTSDSNYAVKVKAPSQNGLYTVTCTFNGSASYTPSTVTDTFPFVVSSQHALGSAQLFTTPSRLVPNQTFDLYLVLHAAPGLPTPTGDYQIWMGNWFTNSIKLTSSGDSLIRVLAPPDLSGINQITIHYHGDTNYDITNISFPMTNPPVPGNTGTPSSGTVSTSNNPHATPPAVATISATTTPDSETLTPTSVGAGGVTPHGSSSSPSTGDSSGLWLIVILALFGAVILGSAAGIAIYLIRRRKALPGTSVPQMGGSSYGYGYPPPSQAEWEQDTQHYSQYPHDG